MPAYTHYALVQPGYNTIFGVGITEAEAREDAVEWLTSTEEEPAEAIAASAPYCHTLIDAYRDGRDLCVVRCTNAFYSYVRTEGTCDWADDPENQGICLPEELEEDA